MAVPIYIFRTSQREELIMSRFSRFTKKALAIVLCAAVVATGTIVTTEYKADTVTAAYQSKLDSVYVANPYFDKNVFAAGTAYAPVIEAAYDSGASLRDFLFNVYVNNSTYYPTPESFFYSTKPTITLNEATGVVMYQDDYANCMRYHNGEMAAEVVFYQTMLDSGIFTEVLREMGSNSYYSGIGLDWTQAINKRTAYMTALGYEAKDIYVFAPPKEFKSLEWYVYSNDTKYSKRLRTALKSKHSSVMFTAPGYDASKLSRSLKYLDDLYVVGTSIQPVINSHMNSVNTEYPDWDFNYPYTSIVDQGAFGIATSPYTMDMIYNNL